GAIPSGLKNLDTMINGGFRAPETSLFAARTNVGKSTLALNVCEGMLLAEPTAGALYVCMEMPHVSFTTKLLASRTPTVTVAAIRRKSLNAGQWTDLTSAIAGVQNLE